MAYHIFLKFTADATLVVTIASVIQRQLVILIKQCDDSFKTKATSVHTLYEAGGVKRANDLINTMRISRDERVSLTRFFVIFLRFSLLSASVIFYFHSSSV